MAEPTRRAAATEYPPLRGGKLLFLTAAIATASFMEILDMTIVNGSVPAISGRLGVSTSEGTWGLGRGAQRRPQYESHEFALGREFCVLRIRGRHFLDGDLERAR
jgi:DHA2 family multidrug resistance protein